MNWCVLRRIMWCGIKFGKEGKDILSGTFKYLQTRRWQRWKSQDWLFILSMCAIDLFESVQTTFNMEWIDANRDPAYEYSGCRKGEKHDKGHTDRLSAYGILSYRLMPFSDLVLLTSTSTIVKKELLCDLSFAIVVGTLATICARWIQVGGQIINNLEVLSCIDVELVRLPWVEGPVNCFVCDFCITNLRFLSFCAWGYSVSTVSKSLWLGERGSGPDCTAKSRWALDFCPQKQMLKVCRHLIANRFWKHVKRPHVLYAHILYPGLSTCTILILEYQCR